MRNNVFLGLVHYPVYNKNSEVVATSVTNFDIHDISRSCRTYDINKYFIITPVDAQKELTSRIIGFWQEGDGIDFNKDRNEAFENTLLSDSIEDSIKTIEKMTGKTPVIVTTSARMFENTVSFSELSNKIFNDDEVYLLLFGTGWGLTQEVMDMSKYILEPIRINTRYNHLSVRAAVAIILDRLFGEK
ncbi:RNA methyltransferase [Pseudostreptobacillus hongkongensis]|uniref:RNA methyltransferase n=1 Tax=Pseudostreptobacillus hongkongensis TaxID=1162717 RepID=UPI0028D3CBF3|nr:RNA methyltransferase [Pseudostreptobacillus hongkongensis]